MVRNPEDSFCHDAANIPFKIKYSPNLITCHHVSDSMILLGSVKRFELERMLWVHLSEDQKTYLPVDEDEGINSRGSTPGSSRAPTPPPRVEIIPDTPQQSAKPRFMVTKVNETESGGKKKNSKVNLSRSVSIHHSQMLLG